jgi:hypothetical protein
MSSNLNKPTRSVLLHTENQSTQFYAWSYFNNESMTHNSLQKGTKGNNESCTRDTCSCHHCYLMVIHIYICIISIIYVINNKYIINKTTSLFLTRNIEPIQCCLYVYTLTLYTFTPWSCLYVYTLKLFQFDTINMWHSRMWLERYDFHAPKNEYSLLKMNQEINTINQTTRTNRLTFWMNMGDQTLYIHVRIQGYV